jgi:hypothetical protein
VRKIPDKSYDDVVKHDFTKNAIIYDLAWFQAKWEMTKDILTSMT